MDVSDVSVTWVISVSATVLLLTYFWFSRRNPKLPPSPLRAWPIVGNLLQLDPDPREQFARFRKQYGDIFSLYLGPNHVVVLNGLDLAKEAFIKQGDDCSDRAVIFFDITTGVNKGLFASNGAIWKENRAFSTAVLRNFGLGKNILAQKIQEEVNYFLDLIESFKGEPTNIEPFIAVSVSNIICSIVAGQRYEYADKGFQRILEILKFNMSTLKGTALLNYFQWLRYLPGDFFDCKIIEKNFQEFNDIFTNVYLKENEDVVGEPGNVIAAYLQEIKMKEKTGEHMYLDKPNLSRLILDLFLAGTDTIYNTLGWFFLYMVNYPDVQEKIHQEIKDLVGLERTTDMHDKTKLIYLMATIMEVQRLVNLVPLSAPRVLPRDVNLRGYFLPKGSQIILNYESILCDPFLWGDDADKFRPERFISEDGTILTPEAWIPFSIGRRFCLGESMAIMELFLYTSNILQRFQALPADPNAIPPVKGNTGLTRSPLQYVSRLVSRK